MPETPNDELFEEIEKEGRKAPFALEKRVNVKTNKIALFVIVSGYLLFFLISRFLPSTRDLLYTPVGQEMEFGSRLYTIGRWVYSPTQRIMEIELNIVNNAFDGHDTYNFQARQRAGKTTQLQTEIIIEEPSFVVLQIFNVADNFDEVALWWSPQEIDNYGISKLYTNREAVDKVETITAKTKQEYYLDRMKRNVNLHRKEIEQLNSQLTENQTTIQEIVRQNETLEENKVYQTTEEIAVVDARIEANNKRIAGIEKENEELRNKAISLESVVDEILEKIQELEGQEA